MWLCLGEPIRFPIPVVRRPTPGASAPNYNRSNAFARERVGRADRVSPPGRWLTRVAWNTLTLIGRIALAASRGANPSLVRPPVPAAQASFRPLHLFHQFHLLSPDRALGGLGRFWVRDRPVSHRLAAPDYAHRRLINPRSRGPAASPPAMNHLPPARFSDNDRSGSPIIGVTRQMLHDRTREMAVQAGRLPLQITQSDYEQARRELTGESAMHLQEAVLDASPAMPNESGETDQAERDPRA